MVAALLLLAALAAALAPGAAAGAPPPAVNATAAVAAAAGLPQRRVASPEEFKAALLDPAVASIAVVKPMALPSGWGPVEVARTLLITSPFRAIIDWCDAACAAGRAPGPLIVLGPGAMVTFNRLFFRNMVPGTRRALGTKGLDFANSPVPLVTSRGGGQATYNLVVMHWAPRMLWVLDEPGTFWAQAKAADAIAHVGRRAPFQTASPRLYNVKNFATDGSGTVADSYMPFDVDGCYNGDEPFDMALIYCPYTFKDSLRNPYAAKVVVFHDVGLDRLVNSYRNPAVVNRTVLYESCPGTRHVMELDNITASVVVSAGGALTFRNMVMQGSKSQNKTDWPSDVPLLLSTFKPVDSGTVVLRDCTVRVHNVPRLVEALNALPSGASALVEMPNLQPSYLGPKPSPGSEAPFTIRLWQLQLQRWLLSRNGGQTLMDKLASSGTASWQFFNVSVEGYAPPDCFSAAYVQGSIPDAGAYSTVSTGQQLLDQLANATARYIRVVNSLALPWDLPAGAVTVSRIVEVRACTEDGGGSPYVVDWGANRGAVVVQGSLIMEGHMAMTGLGWDNRDAAAGGGNGTGGNGGNGGGEAATVVPALLPTAQGVVELEDVSLEARMPPAAYGSDQGEAAIAALVGVKDLDAQPLNMSLLHPGELLLRGYYRSLSGGGGNGNGGGGGVESFLDVTLRWQAGDDSAASRRRAPPVAAVVVPVVVVVLLLGAVGAFVLMRVVRRRAAQAAGDGGGKGALLPGMLADGYRCACGSFTGVRSSAGGAGGAAGRCDLHPHHHPDAADRTPSSTTNGGGSHHGANGGGGSSTATGGGGPKRSGPSADILAACRELAAANHAHHAAGGAHGAMGRADDDELVLEEAIGEGSYGKVFRAMWRGTVVAVKVMVLPSYMSGREKREKMAVMETAISSSLRHPNVVQTYTYAVEPVRANSKIGGGGRDGGGHGKPPNGPLASLHDSSNSWRANGGGEQGQQGQQGGRSSGGDGAAFSWEVRLVQEFCDMGTLRDALKQGRFHDGGGGGGDQQQAGPEGAAAEGAGAAAAGAAAHAAAAAAPPSAPRRPRLTAMVDTALDVARAMAHLHRNNILHSDLKARNVLLRSDNASPRGFVAKVGDFGLSMAIDPHATHISNAFQGTMTHMAPETLVEGRVSRASDVYAMGILLWELYTGEHAYKGVPRALLGHKITRQGVRPVFPPDAPFEWQFLACRCWESDPAIRPTFDQIMDELKRVRARWDPAAAVHAAQQQLGSSGAASGPPSTAGGGGTPSAAAAAAAAAAADGLLGAAPRTNSGTAAGASGGAAAAADGAAAAFGRTGSGSGAHQHHQQLLQQQLAQPAPAPATAFGHHALGGGGGGGGGSGHAYGAASAAPKLPSITDVSDTLPTAVDRQLWEEAHAQTLAQQRLQQEELVRRQSSGLSSQPSADGAALLLARRTSSGLTCTLSDAAGQQRQLSNTVGSVPSNGALQRAPGGSGPHAKGPAAASAAAAAAAAAAASSSPPSGARSPLGGAAADRPYAEGANGNGASRSAVIVLLDDTMTMP